MNDRIPAEVFPPGEFLRDELDARGWSQVELAEVLGRPPRLISEVVSGKRAITPETAKGLAAALGTSAQLWMNLETSYQLSRARTNDADVARRSFLYTNYPVKEMIKRGWVEASENISVLEKQFLTFFSIKHIADAPTFSHAAKKREYSDPASRVQLAWLNRAKQLAMSVSAGAFSVQKLKAAIELLRARRAHIESAREVPKILAEAGVRVVVVERLPSLKMDGACFWLDSNSPVIVLSFQYDRIGNFWHTLFHEIDHVLHGEGKDDPIVEEMTKDDTANLSECERRADGAAAENALPQVELEAFVARLSPLFSKASIVGFARRMEVHPGIVVGQLQRRGAVPWTHHHEMLEKVRDIFVGASLADGFGQKLAI